MAAVLFRPQSVNRRGITNTPPILTKIWIGICEQSQYFFITLIIHVAMVVAYALFVNSFTDTTTNMEGIAMGI